jgi:hypothetical protein
MKAKAAHRAGAAGPEPERRKYPRKGAFWHAQLQTPAGNFECRVTNLSPRGANVEIEHPVAYRETVTLIMEPLGEFMGFVAGRRNGSLGIRIDEHRTTRTEITLPRWGGKDRAMFG